MSDAEQRWKKIDYISGDYSVSDFGNVRNNATGRILKLSLFSNGYSKVTCGRANSNLLVHRLVAVAFIDGDAAMQVNHKNGIRTDCRAENLEWLTCSDNHKHSYRELTRKQHVMTTPVKLVKDGIELAFPSALAASRHLGVVSGSVKSALHRNHKCKGFEVYHDRH